MQALSAIAILLVGILPGLYLLIRYNGLVAARRLLRESWSRVDVELRHRHDLASRAIEIARTDASQQAEALENLVLLRDRCAADRSASRSRGHAEAALTAALQALLAREEAGPRYHGLREELADNEARLARALDAHNTQVRAYRRLSETFPGSLVAGMFGFQTVGLFEIKSSPAQ